MEDQQCHGFNSLQRLSPSSSALVIMPPLSNDQNRCEKALTGNTTDQANGVADKVFRMCAFFN
uniref:Uncharacterized protein n=1 Tax=Physcomitrium patens TaxID=3218 RepID=A0A7I4C2J5_PHYPA